MTVRDTTWDVVLETLVEEGQFKIADLDVDESSHHTVRRVLREMEAMGWLTRPSKHSKTWRAGERAKSLLDLTGYAQRMADQDSAAE